MASHTPQPSSGLKRSYDTYSQGHAGRPGQANASAAAPAVPEKKKKAGEDDWMNKEKRATNYRAVVDGLGQTVGQLMHAFGDDVKPAADSEKVMTEILCSYLIEMSTPPPLPAPVPPLFEPITHTKVSLLTTLRRNLQRHPSHSRALRIIQGAEHKLVIKKQGQKKLGQEKEREAAAGAGVDIAALGIGGGENFMAMARMVGEEGVVGDEGGAAGKGRKGGAAGRGGKAGRGGWGGGGSP